MCELWMRVETQEAVHHSSPCQRCCVRVGVLAMIFTERFCSSFSNWS